MISQYTSAAVNTQVFFFFLELAYIQEMLYYCSLASYFYMTIILLIVCHQVLSKSFCQHSAVSILVSLLIRGKPHKNTKHICFIARATTKALAIWIL